MNNPIENQATSALALAPCSARFSARGMAAIRRGLKPLEDIAREIGAPESELKDAPRREWHHDMRNGAEIWFYDPAKVWSWWNRRLAMNKKLKFKPWRSVAPNRPGWYDFRCGETDYKVERVKVETLNGSLAVQCPNIGQCPVDTYHYNLEAPQWRFVSSLNMPDQQRAP